MRRGPKPTKSKEAQRPVGRKSPENEDSRVRAPEQRLHEALKRETEAQEQSSCTLLLGESPGLVLHARVNPVGRGHIFIAVALALRATFE